MFFLFFRVFLIEVILEKQNRPFGHSTFTVYHLASESLSDSEDFRVLLIPELAGFFIQLLQDFVFHLLDDSVLGFRVHITRG